MTAAQHSSKNFHPVPMVIENNEIALYNEWNKKRKRNRLMQEVKASSLYGAALKTEMEELRKKVVELGGTLPSYYMNRSQLRNRIKTLENNKAQGKKENKKESFWTESLYRRHINDLKRRKNNSRPLPIEILENKGDKGKKGNKGKPMATTMTKKNPKNNNKNPKTNKNPKKTNKNPKKTNGR